MSPLISVILPAYNSEKFIKDAVVSILNQTYSNFELIIIDDGSTDNTERIIRGISDRRIKYYKNASNLGLVDSLNKALQSAKGDFIARMDADDISDESRFERQLELFKSNPSLDLVGTQVEYFGNTSGTSNFPLQNDEIKIALLFGNCIAHPTIMFRRQLYDKGIFKYEKDYLHCEDYYLWTKLITDNVVFGQTSQSLLKYRLAGQNISVNYRQSSIPARIKIIKEYFNKLDINLLAEDLTIIAEYFMVTNMSKRNLKAVIYFGSSLKRKLLNKFKSHSKLIDGLFRDNNHKLFFKMVELSKFWALIFLFRTKQFSLYKFKYLLFK